MSARRLRLRAATLLTVRGITFSTLGLLHLSLSASPHSIDLSPTLTRLLQYGARTSSFQALFDRGLEGRQLIHTRSGGLEVDGALGDSCPRSSTDRKLANAFCPLPGQLHDASPT
jgi:hypothetical protein